MYMSEASSLAEFFFLACIFLCKKVGRRKYIRNLLLRNYTAVQSILCWITRQGSQVVSFTQFYLTSEPYSSVHKDSPREKIYTCIKNVSKSEPDDEKSHTLPCKYTICLAYSEEVYMCT